MREQMRVILAALLYGSLAIVFFLGPFPFTQVGLVVGFLSGAGLAHIRCLTRGGHDDV